MAEYFGKGISVGSGFDLGANLPLDNRTIQATIADRDAMPTIQLVEGLIVYVKEDKTLYVLKSFNADGTNRKWETVATGTVVEIVNSLESDRTDAALSAAQGKVLKTLIDNLKTSLSSVYNYKGSVDTYADLPTNPSIGDVYNVKAKYNNVPAGTNWAWDGTAWDALGGSVDLSGYYTKSEVDVAIGAETTARNQAITTLDGKITTNSNALKNKVDKVEGSSLIPDAKLNQIDTNATAITTIRSEIDGTVDGIGKDVDALKTTVGNASAGLVKDIDDLQADVATIKTAQSNDKVQDVNTTAASGVSLTLDSVTKKVGVSVAVDTLGTALAGSTTLKGSTVKIGAAISDGATIPATDTIADAIQKLGSAIKTAQSGGITSISSDDNSIAVTGTGNSRNIKVQIANIVAADSALKADANDKLDLFWTEVE